MEDSDFGWTGLDKEDDTHVTKEKSRYRYDGMLDTKTMTNPTDKTVVHLLKHLMETKESCEGETDRGRRIARAQTKTIEDDARLNDGRRDDRERNGTASSERGSLKTSTAQLFVGESSERGSLKI
ncbi:hypothetical protein Bca4012_031658 [Brassica carinata]|uniref:Uncharacterized protein n=1 Tax=Brassica carinata TaxID=52824 RepID=A0A8X7RD00_BRACI|nr:hypothetical protein Bca52824_046513 [Brassica carinata]